MMTKLVRWQLLVFLVIAVVGVAFVGAKYARIDKMLGIGQYTVTAQFPDSGGIFTNAEVTYQGVPVGRVGDLHLTEKGIDVDLLIDSSNKKIPASAKAMVASRSAIGEQFVDLRPTSNDGPYLEDGSTIANGTIPVPLDQLLKSGRDFAQSVDTNALRTVITELGKAFGGQGENLRSLLDSLNTLAKAGVKSLPDTISLLQNSNVVLDTQADQSDAILDWSRNLGLITRQLQTSDPDLRRLLTTGNTSASELSALLERSGGDVTTAVRDLASDLRYNKDMFKPLDSVLAMLEGLAPGSKTTAPGDGTIHFGVVLETNNPVPCTRGYEGTQAIIDEMKRKNPNFNVNYDEFPFNRDARCLVPQGNPTSVRGAERAKLADPDVTQPWDNKPKKDPDKLNLNPLAQQMAWLLGVRAK